MSSRILLVWGVIFVILAGKFSFGNESNSPIKSQAACADKSWVLLQRGLEFAEMQAPEKSMQGDSLIRILRIDLRYYALKLLNASASADKKLYTAKQWAEQHGLIAAINPSMYQQDYLTSTALMKTHDHTNNPTLSKDKAILAFDPRDHGLPHAVIIDRECDDFNLLQKQYESFVQSIRMISCQGKNVWAQQPHQWSTAVIAIDKQDRILFIHVQSPYSTHDLIDYLLTLPLDIDRAFYAEGGAQAQLYLKNKDFEREFIGYPGKKLSVSSLVQQAQPIPNVLGIISKFE